MFVDSQQIDYFVYSKIILLNMKLSIFIIQMFNLILHILAFEFVLFYFLMCLQLSICYYFHFR